MASKTTLTGGLDTFIGFSYLLEWIHIVLIMNYYSVKCQNGPPVPFYENTVVFAFSDILTNVFLFTSVVAFYHTARMSKKSYPLTILFLFLDSAPIVGLLSYIRMAVSESGSFDTGIVAPGIILMGMKCITTVITVIVAVVPSTP